MTNAKWRYLAQASTVTEGAGVNTDASVGADALAGTVRRGRPPSTSSRVLRQIALRLFLQNGFEATTIDQIASVAGVSERTFFRYFATKASVLWTEFDAEVDAIRAALAKVKQSSG